MGPLSVIFCCGRLQWKESELPRIAKDSFAVTCWISCQPLRAICSGRLQFDVSGWSLKKLKKNMRRLRNCSVLFTLYVAVFCVWLRKKDAISQRTGGSYLLISLQWESRDEEIYCTVVWLLFIFFYFKYICRLSLLGSRCKACSSGE